MLSSATASKSGGLGQKYEGCPDGSTDGFADGLEDGSADGEEDGATDSDGPAEGAPDNDGSEEREGSAETVGACVFDFFEVFFNLLDLPDK